MENFLNYGFLGTTFKNWLLAAAFILGGFIVGKICSWIVSTLIHRLAQKTKHSIDDIIVSVIKRPLVLLLSLIGLYLGMRRINLGESVLLWVDRFFSALVIVIIAWAIDSLAGKIITKYVPPKGPDSASLQKVNIQPLLKNLFATLIWIFAGAFVLKAFGYNVSALLAGLGLGGAAVALASKDTLANFFGSITVFVDKPFKLNDRIKIAGFDGYITEMGLRTSRLKTLENRVITIPNSLFTSSPIENISSEPNTKVQQAIHVSRDNTIEKLDEVAALLKDSCLEVRGTEGPTEAGLVTVNGNLCLFNLVYYVKKNFNYLETVNNVNIKILRCFEDVGIKIL